VTSSYPGGVGGHWDDDVATAVVCCFDRTAVGRLALQLIGRVSPYYPSIYLRYGCCVLTIDVIIKGVLVLLYFYVIL